jgi:hypothetical protein
MGLLRGRVTKVLHRMDWGEKEMVWRGPIRNAIYRAHNKYRKRGWYPKKTADKIFNYDSQRRYNKNLKRYNRTQGHNKKHVFKPGYMTKPPQNVHGRQKLFRGRVSLKDRFKDWRPAPEGLTWAEFEEMPVSVFTEDIKFIGTADSE